MGLTQKELADKLKVDRSTVTKWELGQSFPKTKVLIELSKIFGCTVDELLKGESDIARVQVNDNTS